MICVLSDLHVDLLNKDDYEDLLYFLKNEGKRFEKVVINGDSFNAPPKDKPFLPYGMKVVNAFYQLLIDGKEIIFVVGNHDIGVSSLTCNIKKPKFSVVYPGVEFKYEGKKIRIEHGHGYDPFYITRLYDIARLVEKASGINTGEIVVDAYKEIARTLQLPQKDALGVADQILEIWERAAGEIITEKKTDIVLMGHTHSPVLKRVKKGIYGNSGSWPGQKTMLLIENGILKLCKFEERKIKDVKSLNL